MKFIIATYGFYIWLHSHVNSSTVITPFHSPPKNRLTSSMSMWQLIIACHWEYAQNQQTSSFPFSSIKQKFKKVLFKQAFEEYYMHTVAGDQNIVLQKPILRWKQASCPWTFATTTTRASAAKWLKFTDSSTSSTTAEYVATTRTSYSRPAVFFGNPLAWTSPQYSGAELVRQAFSGPLSTSTPVSTQPVGKLTKISLFPSQIRRLLSSGMHLTEKPWTLSTRC